jgi:cytochrome c-type biogenesis protein CcmH/NrfG
VRVSHISMRTFFSLAALLVVFAIVALLARKQLSSVAVPDVPATGAAGAPSSVPAPPRGTPQQQLDQFRQGLNDALQQPPRKIDE